METLPSPVTTKEFYCNNITRVMPGRKDLWTCRSV